MNVKLLLGMALSLAILAMLFYMMLIKSESEPKVEPDNAYLEESTTNALEPALSGKNQVPESALEEIQLVSKVGLGTGSQKSASKNLDSSFPKDIQRVEKDSNIVLWTNLNEAKDIEINTVKAKQFTVDPRVLEQFHVGQNIEFATLNDQQTIHSQLTSTRNQLGGVSVWNGKIKNGHPNDKIIITRGKIETHVVVSTTEGTYTTIIDNKTGSATLVDEGEIIAGQLPTEDGIYVEGIDDSPPAQSTHNN